MKRFLKTASAVDPASPFPDTEARAQARPFTNLFLPHWPCPSVIFHDSKFEIRLGVAAFWSACFDEKMPGRLDPGRSVWFRFCMGERSSGLYTLRDGGNR